MWFTFQQADETLDFEEQILEAAKSIAAATSALVKSASAAQRELVAQGKVSLHNLQTLATCKVLCSNTVQHLNFSPKLYLRWDPIKPMQSTMASGHRVSYQL